MNNKERKWLYRISRCLSAKRVTNPADIKHKMMFYNEQIEITKILSNTLYELFSTEYSNEEKEESVIYLEEQYKKITTLKESKKQTSTQSNDKMIEDWEIEKKRKERLKKLEESEGKK